MRGRDGAQRRREPAELMPQVAADPFETGEAWLRPSGRLRSLRRTQAIAVTAVVLTLIGALVAVAAAIGDRSAVPVGLAVAGGTLAAGLIGERLLQRRVRSWAYCEREDDLLIRRGVLIRRLSVVPYGRMQFIDVVAGPLERIFGLATVRMHTAAAASGARIPGLDATNAALLRDHLAMLGESKLAGL